MLEHNWRYERYKDEYLGKSHKFLENELNYYTKKLDKLQHKLEINRKNMTYINKYFNRMSERKYLWKINAIEEILNEYNSKYKLGSVL
ncbi:hypothetical protein FNU3_60 [Fusobacterium phage vB_FnuS_FNU3]|nr:hypothetical protein FNU2_70 [Fusobacterium phage vB_FnuS_FNU2]WGH50435.1 hypothetical protein FNU3_60 [Fusobacterium phage vB_FnuS_FNU3]